MTTKALPSIANCACGKQPKIESFGRFSHSVICYSPFRWCWQGPSKLTKLEAIKAWNRVMGKEAK